MSQYLTSIKLKMLPLQHVTILHRYQLKMCFCSMSQYITGMKLKVCLLQHVTILDRYQTENATFAACHNTSQASTKDALFVACHNTSQVSN